MHRTGLVSGSGMEKRVWCVDAGAWDHGVNLNGFRLQPELSSFVSWDLGATDSWVMSRLTPLQPHTLVLAAYVTSGLGSIQHVHFRLPSVSLILLQPHTPVTTPNPPQFTSRSRTTRPPATASPSASSRGRARSTTPIAHTSPARHDRSSPH